ncbi:MurR/RpiR family transcriptional regulator [Mediterraneibacter sp. NSJ-55]|uniref:MurR/RpiR family transcriptional regulator n=1 Tax=Mediterraneibacter hominis TaxID=2763054 RepID=A0A923LIY6_9FIRM|nr:MurR/RpiR family transcriptional regulator [Mediterraneibacter hominis]MBC5689135.1 MurR/RpiR family transcriptional regulator [Mediterraneibacter hominis]
MEYTVKQRIQNIYAALRPSEQKVAEYILSYPGQPKELLIEEVAKNASVSQPTVIRFVKAAGYKGFKELKYAMMQEEILYEKETGKEKENVSLYGFSFSGKESLEEIPGKIITTSVQMLEETLRSIQMKEYKKAVEAVSGAENIVLYSVENSNCIANDLLTKLTYLGLNCRMYSDYYLQSVSAGNLTRKDLAIGISYSGYSKHTVEMMRMAKKAGARTMVITNFDNALIAKYADILLCTSSHQFFCGNTIFSRISQLALVDMLYVGVLNENYGRMSKRLKKNSDLVAERAYDEN